jgi:hypothetical protein
MLDWLDQMLTRAPQHLREMGHVRELWGIRQRWRQFHAHWAPHCENTRQVIRQAIAQARTRKRAAVLGSGWLLDVPIEDLASQFEEVLLVDLLHPFSIRWWARRWPNVHLLEADVGEVALVAWQVIEAPGTPLPASRPSLFLGDTSLGLTVSCNLLSQIPVMPAWYLRKHRYPEKEVEAFSRQAIEAHLAYLARLPGVVCLVADTEAITLTPGGEEVSRRSTLNGARLPWQGATWRWRLLPRRDRPPYHAEELHVVGVPNIHGLA